MRSIVALFAQHGYKRLEETPRSPCPVLVFVSDYKGKRQKVIVLYQPRGTGTRVFVAAGFRVDGVNTLGSAAALAGMPPASEKQLLEQLSVAIPGAEKQMEAAERATKRRSRLWRGGY